MEIVVQSTSNSVGVVLVELYIYMCIVHTTSDVCRLCFLTFSVDCNLSIYVTAPNTAPNTALLVLQQMLDVYLVDTDQCAVVNFVSCFCVSRSCVVFSCKL